MRTDHLKGLAKKGSDIPEPKKCANGICKRVIKERSGPSARLDDYCSQGCAEAARRTISQKELRAALQESQKGVCQLCGLDTKSITGMLVADRAAIQLAATDLRKLLEPVSPGFSPPSPSEIAKARQRVMALEGVYEGHIRLWKGFPRKALEEGLPLWEADHRDAKVLGGPTSIENGQTACLRCHAAKTAKLAGDRAASRRPSTDPRFWKAHGERRKKNRGMR